MPDTEYYGVPPTETKENEFRYEGVCAPSQTAWPFTYNVGFVDVYVNGTKLPATGFTAVDGSNIFISGVSTGATVCFVSRKQVPVSTSLSNLTLSTPLTLTGTTAVPTPLQWSRTDGAIGSKLWYARIEGDHGWGVGRSNDLGTPTTQYLKIMPGGNVGIGTTSANEKLEVAGNLRFTGAAYVYNMSSYMSISAAGQMILGSGAGSPISFRSGGSAVDSAILDANGNLGINTVPSAWNTNLKAIEVGSGAGFSLGYSQGGSGVGMLSSNVYLDQSSNYVRKTTGYSLQYQQDITYGSHSFFTAASGSAGSSVPMWTQALTIDNQGRVGVGINTPQAKLHVKGTSSTALVVDGSGTGTGTVDTGALAQFWGHDGVGQYAWGQIGGFKENGTVGDQSSYVSISTRVNGGNLTEKLRVTSTGNLAVGTPVPQYPWSAGFKTLDLGDNGGLSSWISGTAALSLVNNAYFNAGVWKRKTSDYATMLVQDSGIFSFYTAPTATAGSTVTWNQSVVVNSQGYLGVGLTSPSRPITINNTNSQIQFVNSTTGTASTDGLLVGMGGAASADAYINQLENASLIFNTNGVERLRLTNTGQIQHTCTHDGQVGVYLKNTSAIGLGTRLDGGSAGNYSLSVRNYQGTELFQVSGAGDVLVTGGGGLGYGTGSGGTMLQGSSFGKQTSVTFNKTSGRVTMNNASLAAGSTVSFSLNNNNVGIADCIVVTFWGSVNCGNYNIWAVNNGGGVVQVYLRNISAGNLSDAVEFNFTVIRGSTT